MVIDKIEPMTWEDFARDMAEMGCTVVFVSEPKPRRSWWKRLLRWNESEVRDGE